MAVSGGHTPKAASLSTEMAADAPPPPNVKPSRLVLVLMAFGAACGLALALAFEWTQPRIDAHQSMLIEGAVHEVLKGPDHFTTLYLDGNSIADKPPAGLTQKDAEKIYEGFDAGGKVMGFAVPASGPGFQDNVKLIFGYDPATEQVTGMKLIDQRETPGIGDRVEKDTDFVKEFMGPRAPLEGVKPGRGQGNPHAIDMITGATISSRAVIAIINKRLVAVGPALKAYMQQQGGAR